MDYFIITDANGNGIGGGYTNAGLSAGQYACTQEQSLNPTRYAVNSGGEIVSAADARLLEVSQAAQNATLKRAYLQSIGTYPVTINGTSYTLALGQANVIATLYAFLSAQQALASPAWEADVDVVFGQLCTVSGVPLFCSTAGKTGSTAPTVPSAIGTPATDGTAEWELFARSAELSNGSFAWFTAAEIVSVSQQIELFLHSQKSTLTKLLAEVQAATTVSAVESITWP
jgi:hypothetical protein